MRNMYNNRQAILDEPISPEAYRNQGLRLRSKLERSRKIFEDRLASVVLKFSSKIDIDVKTVTEIAKAWIF